MNSVTIYSTPMCTYCKLAKDFFKEHGVAYREVDVLGDLEARKYMMEKSGQKKVPVFEVDGEMFVGFTESKEEFLKRLQLKSRA